MPFVPGEGPFCICLSPSRELARQTHDVVSGFCDALAEEGRCGCFVVIKAVQCLWLSKLWQMYCDVALVTFFKPSAPLPLC